MTYQRGTCIAVITAALGAVWALVSSGQPAPSKVAEPPAVWATGVIMPAYSDKADAIAVSYQGAIWRMPRGGGSLTRLTLDEGFDIYPAWSPDGARIAFAKSRDF